MCVLQTTVKISVLTNGTNEVFASLRSKSLNKEAKLTVTRKQEIPLTTRNGGHHDGRVIKGT